MARARERAVHAATRGWPRDALPRRRARSDEVPVGVPRRRLAFHGRAATTPRASSSSRRAPRTRATVLFADDAGEPPRDSLPRRTRSGSTGPRDCAGSAGRSTRFRPSRAARRSGFRRRRRSGYRRLAAGRRLVVPGIEDAEALQGFDRGWTDCDHGVACTGHTMEARRQRGDGRRLAMARRAARASPASVMRDDAPLEPGARMADSGVRGAKGRAFRVACLEYPRLAPTSTSPMWSISQAAPLSRRGAAGLLRADAALDVAIRRQFLDDRRRTRRDRRARLYSSRSPDRRRRVRGEPDRAGVTVRARCSGRRSSSTASASHEIRDASGLCLAVQLAVGQPLEDRVLGRALRSAASRPTALRQQAATGQSSSESTRPSATGERTARRTSTSFSHARRASHGVVHGSSTSFASLAERWGIVLDRRTASSALAEAPDIQEGEVGALLMALEAKATMTAHVRALPRLFDELTSSHSTVHGASNNALSVGLAMVNLADEFVSSDLNKGLGP